MAETGNTAKMAEGLCDELFLEFLWRKVGPINHDWACVDQATHEVKTHPTDVVYFYDEPYAERRTYLQCDLKSYQTGSITSTAVRKAIESLAKQVSCAEKSEEWRDLYAHDHVTYSVTGLLIVYNHDGGYDANFSENLRLVQTEKIDIPVDSKIVVLGPKEVFWLDNVRYDVRQLRGSSGADKLPAAEHCRYFFPQLASRAVLQSENARAATVEMMTSAWIVLEHAEPQKRKGVVVFYRREGKTIDEFIYLLDYLRQHDLLDESIDVRIRAVEAHSNCKINFQKAYQRYIDEMSDGDGNNDLARNVKAIKFDVVTQVKTTFSTQVIGMDYE